MSADRQIQCIVCGSDFTFTAEEQEFFESKGFQDPKKCKPCRDAAKQSRGGGRGGFGGGQRRERQFFDAVCSGCGLATQVPFKPNGTKPVYCRECFQNTSSAASYY